MTNIDRWLDVDFTKCKEYVRGYHETGNLKVYGRYGDKVDLIPESQWDGEVAAIAEQKNGADALVTRILNQSSEGSCVGNAATQAHQVIQALQFGKDRVVQLSAISMYKQIGSSPNSGAMVDDAMKKGCDVGWVPLDNDANKARFGSMVMPPTGFYSKYPDGWQATAKQFRYQEVDVIESIAEMMTALIRRQPVVVGRQGHSICYCTPMKKNGSWVVKYANSWGEWGDAGFGYDTLSQMKMSAGWAYSPRSIIVPEHLK